jgi:hypothetical protein
MPAHNRRLRRILLPAVSLALGGLLRVIAPSLTTSASAAEYGGVIALSSGHIALQAEGAEVFYRNIRVKEMQ